MKEAVSGPWGWPLAGHLPAFLREPLGFLTRCAERHPGVTRLRLGGPTLLLQEPEDLRHVLLAHAANYRKSARIIGPRGKRIFGEALIASSGEEHRRKRGALQPLFHRRAIAVFAETVERCTVPLLERWAAQGRVALRAEMTALTKRIIVEAVFGETAPAEELAALLEVRRRHTERSLRRPLPRFFPSRLARQYAVAARRLRDLVHGLLAAPGDGPSLLALLAGARFEDGSGFAETELHDEALSLVMAGYETLADALTWTLWLLATHPEAEARAAEEAQAGGEENAPWLTAVFAEALRLYPPTWLFLREAVAADRLPSGAAVAPGVKLYLSPWVTHRDARFFPEPLRFRPERFLSPERERIPRFAYFPFGGGARVCIGEALAQMEARLVLTAVLRRFRFRPAAGKPVTPRAGITLQPAREITLALAPR